MKSSHVLITRPEPQSTELAELLKQRGFAVITLPVFRFVPNVPGVDFNTAWPSQGRRLAVFCSTRAVEFGLRQLPAGFLDKIEIAAIGPATARMLESAGHPPTILPEAGFDSESLLSEAALSRHPGSALIFAAPEGRQKLYETLLRRGWKVRFAHVYRGEGIEPPAAVVDAILASEKLVSVWTSAKALEYVATKLDRRAWQRIAAGAMVVISGRIAELARTLGRDKVVRARGPGNADIVAALGGQIGE